LRMPVEGLVWRDSSLFCRVRVRQERLRHGKIFGAVLRHEHVHTAPHRSAELELAVVQVVPRIGLLGWGKLGVEEELSANANHDADEVSEDLGRQPKRLRGFFHLVHRVARLGLLREGSNDPVGRNGNRGRRHERLVFLRVRALNRTQPNGRRFGGHSEVVPAPPAKSVGVVAFTNPFSAPTTHPLDPRVGLRLERPVRPDSHRH